MELRRHIDEWLREWKKDPALCKSLAETIRKSEATTCLEGHWVPVPKEDTIQDLLEGE